MARPTTCHRAKRHALWFMMLANLAVQPLQAQDDWPAWGRDAGNQRHSPLTQINPSNVSTLVPAWRYEMKEEGVPSRPSQSTPLVVDGVLYLSFPFYRRGGAGARDRQAALGVHRAGRLEFTRAPAAL